jgi:hypothetical protein
MQKKEGGVGGWRSHLPTPPLFPFLPWYLPSLEQEQKDRENDKSCQVYVVSCESPSFAFLPRLVYTLREYEKARI